MTAPTPAEPTRGQVEGVPPEVGGAANSRAWGLAPTPAVPMPSTDRVRKRMDEYAETYQVRGDFAVSVLKSEFEQARREAVTAALTDPDDPDSLARTLFVLHHTTAQSMTADEAVRVWNERIGIEPRRERWRAVADGLRMMLTGSGA